LVNLSQNGRFSVLRSATASLRICDVFWPVTKSVVFGFSFCCGSRFAIARFARAFLGFLGLMLTTESPFQTPGYPYTYTCFSILSLFCKVGDAKLLAGTFSRRSMPGPGKCWPESDKRRVPWWWGVLAGLVPHIGGAKPLSTSESSNYFLITYQITNC
jgi:hypothetical protein